MANPFDIAEDAFVSKTTSRNPFDIAQETVKQTNPFDVAQANPFDVAQSQVQPQQQEASPLGEQFAESGKSFLYGAADRWVGIFESAPRAIAHVSDKLAQKNRNEYQRTIDAGEDPEGWRARSFDALATFHEKAKDYWLNYEGGWVIKGGIEGVKETRDAVAEKLAPMTSGFVTDVARGLGGMTTLPLDLSPAGVVSIPAQMFDEGYQQSTGTEQERLDKATAYTFIASPIETAGDIMLKKFGGRATARGMKAILLSSAKKLGLNFASEGGTEVLQDAVLNKLNGKAMFDENSLRTFLVSGTIGTIVSGGVTVNDQVKIDKTIKNFENMGLSQEDAIEATNLIIDRKIKEASVFVAKRARNLTDVIETAQIASSEANPIDDKQAKRLQSLIGKDVLTDEERAEIESIAMNLDESDRQKVYDAIERVQGSDAVFNELIGRLTGQEARDDTKRTEKAGTEQGKVEGQQQERVPPAGEQQRAQEPGSAEEVLEELKRRSRKNQNITTEERIKIATENENIKEGDKVFVLIDGVVHLATVVKNDPNVSQIEVTGDFSFVQNGQKLSSFIARDTVLKQEAPTQEAPKQAPIQEKVASERTIDDFIEISIEKMNRRLEEFGQEPLGDVDRKSWKESMRNAIESGQLETIEALLMESAFGGKVQFTDEQVMAAGALMAQINNQIDVIGDKIEVAKTKQEIEALKAQESALQLRLQNAMIGLRDAVTTSARAVSAMGAAISKKDYSVKSLLQQAIKAKGEPLTQQEIDDITEASRNTRKAQNEVNDIKTKEKKKVSLKDRIDELRENIVDMKRTIKKRSRKPQSEDAKRLAELRRIERQQDNIFELIDILRSQELSDKDSASAKDPYIYGVMIKNLRDAIHKSKWYVEAKTQKSKQSTIEKLDATLKDLQDQYNGKYRNIPEGKEKSVSDEDIKAMRDAIRETQSLINIEDQIADLEEQIRTGVFKKMQKKPVKRQSQELTDAKIKLNQLQREAREKIYNLRSMGWRDKVKNWATLPRSIMATADMSYGLRQGLLPSFAHPVIAAKTWGLAFKSFFSQYTADQIDIAMREDPLFDDFVSLGTHFSSMDSAIESRTEYFASNLAEKIPYFGALVRASERNMVTGVNLLRYGLMKDFVAKHPDASQEAMEAYAKYVNVATGRGEAKMLDRSAEELSLVFFAPRFAFSRVQAPWLAVQNMQHPELRAEIIKQWVSYLGTGMTVLALAKLAGAEIGDLEDPEDSDWGKIIIGGNKRIDIWGGIQQPMRLLAKGLKGGYEQMTEGETDVNPIEDMWRFLSFKLSPPVQMINELVSGQDIIGRETETDVSGVEIPRLAAVAAKNMTPLIFQSALEAYREGEDPLPILGLAAGEGLGLSIGVYDK